MKKVLSAGIALSLLMLLALPAFSQTLTGNITARAQDSTGAVIPGVEVTISSPSMIGGSRKEVTDETGAYRFTLLPPGTYRVSFSLAGFKTLNVDGVQITGGATATTVGVLEVAATAEEITITSQAPTIDLESATVGVNISQKMMDELPWSRSLTGMSMMIPGVFSTSFDIGNSNFGTSSTIAARSGGRSGGNVVTIDGLLWCQSYANYGSFEEMNVSTNAKGADQMNSGITLAMVVKSGSNAFHGNVSAKYQNGSMQSNNISPELVARGYPTGSNKYTHFDDFYGDIGGPILKDRLWFYGSYRQGYQGTFIPGFRTAVGGDYATFFTKLYQPDAKLTYQMTAKQKLEAYVGIPLKWQPYRGGNALNPQNSTQNQRSWSSQGPMLTYTNIINSKTSLTAKISRGGYWWPAYAYGVPDGQGVEVNQLINGQLVMRRLPTVDWLGVKNVGVRVTDNTTNATDGGFNSNYSLPIRWQESADLSRFANIRGKNHEIKVGYLGWWDQDYTLTYGYPYAQSYTYRSTSTDTCPNGEICSNYFKIPYRVTVTDHPNRNATVSLYRSAYANDKITWNRKLTLNVGLRFDWATEYLPKQGNDGTGPWARKWEITEKQSYYTNRDGSKSPFPVYSLFSPRLSFAYDVFGNGKIAIKGSYGRYIGITSSPGSQPGQGSQNPMATTSCQYNNWDGSIPFDAKRNFGADGLMGTSDDINLASSCARSTVVNGQVVPLNTYKWDEGLRPNFVSEYTAGVEIGFSRDYSLRFNIQRKFDRNGNKSIPVLLPYSAYSDIRCANDPGRDAKAGTADDNPTGQACYYSVPSSNTDFSITNTYYQSIDRKSNEGNDHFTGYTITFNKNYSDSWQYVVAYNIDMAHTTPNNPINPNQVIENARSYQNTGNIEWNQGLKMSGIYGVPDIPLLKGFKLSGVQYSSSFITQNGAWYGRSAQVTDGRGTTQSLVVENHVGRFPWVLTWDQSVRKRFKLTEGQSLEFNWNLYNSTNEATIRSWRSTTVNNSLYLQPDGVTALRPATILSPRIYEWGIAYKF